jgi:hypothetical protein
MSLSARVKYSNTKLSKLSGWIKQDTHLTMGGMLGGSRRL